MNIIKKQSPNFSKRNARPELVVIHIMAGTLAGTDNWFSQPASQVSAHYGIGLNGEIHQYVEEKDKAWHAGRIQNPSFKLYKPFVNPNDYTIGIEHEGYDLFKGSVLQLQASASLLKEICARWSIPLDRDHVIGHYEVFSSKPNCPATDKSVIDKILKLAQGGEEMVYIQVPKSKLARITEFLLKV